MAEKIRNNLSIKHNLINKDNQKILIATGVSAFVVTFSLVASGILYKQMTYQNKVINKGKEQLNQVEESFENVKLLTKEYKRFEQSDRNILTGNSVGVGELDGKNSKIVLDALPSTYNFPALATSVEKIVELSGLEFVSMTGTDDEATQKANMSSATPTPVEMPFEVEVKGTYNASLALVDALERSIRPFQISVVTLTATGDTGDVTTKISGKTYFQPAKNLNLIEETVQ